MQNYDEAFGFSVKLTEDGKAVLISQPQADGSVVEIKVEIGMGLSQLLASLMDHAEFAARRDPNLQNRDMAGEEVPVAYPLRTAVGDTTHPTTGRHHALLGLDYGGAMIGLAMDRNTAETTLRKLIARFS